MKSLILLLTTACLLATPMQFHAQNASGKSAKPPVPVKSAAAAKSPATGSGSASDDGQVRAVLTRQTEAWNRNDLEAFMGDYWKNDSLMFIGKSGITYGWQNTLDNYKKNYPDRAAMGKLNFRLIQVKRLSPAFYSVVGKWELQRLMGDLGGHFSLVLQKIAGRWVIISDHSS